MSVNSSLFSGGLLWTKNMNYEPTRLEIVVVYHLNGENGYSTVHSFGKW